MAALVKSQMHSPYSLLSRIGNLLQTSQWSDCTFLVGESDSKQEFRAHRIILAACSPVFEAMCFGPLAEKGSISIPDMEPKAFQALLQYVYTDNVQFTSVEEACDVLYAAKKYMILNLCQMCHLYLKRNMQAKDVVAVYEFAKLLEEEALYEPCLLMLRKYALEVLNDATHHLSPSTVMELLASDALNGCECCLIEGALSWAIRECEERGLEPSIENQRFMLTNCSAWHQLRFLTLSQQQFMRISQIDGLLTQEEIGFLKEFLFKTSDDKRATQYSNMCNSSSCSGIAAFDEMGGNESNESNSNIVVVRDKWKRRRLNMVLIGVENSDETSDKWVESDSAMSTSLDSCFTLSVPPSISDIMRPRKEVGYRLSFCRRPLLKQSSIVAGPLDLEVALMVSAPIDLRAVQVYSRIFPPYAIQKSNTYSEKLEIEVLDETGKLLTYSHFNDKVEYNTEVMVHLNKFVRLTQDRTYRVIVKLMDSMTEYPLSFLGQFARSQDINFTFMDRAAKAGPGFVNRLDMGFIRGFAYS
ncbi:kelch-like protein 6 [Thrips palmi]|uniref:Kelch-like protein 6 n=1 Tax=Thrips palmi TaxID=161013 RepID=A0A6P8YP46_THRPL|nr:kelch-like protein 6 [Thrips palmi]XP_034235862.1 kelch-like protein 6 [Thrips palmi]XP_034235863.1 kelch-like protein 6 [Thrips palmi]